MLDVAGVGRLVLSSSTGVSNCNFGGCPEATYNEFPWVIAAVQPCYEEISPSLKSHEDFTDGVVLVDVLALYRSSEA